MYSPNNYNINTFDDNAKKFIKFLIRSVCQNIYSYKDFIQYFKVIIDEYNYQLINITCLEYINVEFNDNIYYCNFINELRKKKIKIYIPRSSTDEQRYNDLESFYIDYLYYT